MHTQFPLFSSHLDLAHAYWTRLVCPGDTAIDATCGNGFDTLKLASLLKEGGHVIAIDIQPDAIEQTRLRLEEHAAKQPLAKVSLYTQSHVEFPHLNHASVRLIVYNLGYLPRSDKAIKTQASSTLASVQTALDLIMPGGAISITLYPGHLEGMEEQTALLQWARALSPNQWNLCHHQWIHSATAPSLLLIQKTTV